MSIRLVPLGLGGLFVAAVVVVIVWAGPRTEQTSCHFTEAQAEQGRHAYVRHCAECHGTDLEGEAHFPPLTGQRFWNRWAGRTAWQLYEYTYSSMPLSRAASLPDETYAAILAFQLKRYGYSAGTASLAPGRATLRRIGLAPIVTDDSAAVSC